MIRMSTIYNKCISASLGIVSVYSFTPGYSLLRVQVYYEYSLLRVLS